MRDVTLPAAQALMESLWLAALVFPLVVFLDMPMRLDLTTIASLQISISVLGVLGERLPIRLPWRRLLSLLAAALLVVLWLRWVIAGCTPWTLDSFSALVAPACFDARLTPPYLLGAWAVALYASGRGLVLGTWPLDDADVRSSFTRGLAILLCLLVVLQLASLPLDAESMKTLRSLVLRYFALGLLVAALAHRAALHRALGVSAPISLSWLVATLVPIGLLLALALLLVMGGDAARVLMEGAVALLEWLARHVALALTWLVGLCFEVLHWIGMQLSSSSHAPQPRSTGGPSATPSSLESTAFGAPLHVSQTDVLPYMLVVIGLLCAWLFIGLLLRGARRDEPLAREQTSSLWSWSLLARQLRDLARGTLGRARGRGAEMLDQALRRGEPDAGLGDIRAVYRALLRWADDRGHPRTPATTPFELATQLTHAMPESNAGVSEITAHYAAARYGERELAPSELGRARERLHALTHPLAASRRGPADDDG